MNIEDMPEKIDCGNGFYLEPLRNIINRELLPWEFNAYYTAEEQAGCRWCGKKNRKALIPASLLLEDSEGLRRPSMNGKQVREIVPPEYKVERVTQCIDYTEGAEERRVVDEVRLWDGKTYKRHTDVYFCCHRCATYWAVRHLGGWK